MGYSLTGMAWDCMAAARVRGSAKASHSLSGNTDCGQQQRRRQWQCSQRTGRYTSAHLHCHTDCAYMAAPPQLQVFNSTRQSADLVGGACRRVESHLLSGRGNPNPTHPHPSRVRLYDLGVAGTDHSYCTARSAAAHCGVTAYSALSFLGSARTAGHVLQGRAVGLGTSSLQRSAAEGLGTL
jgi:hypothetical protein